MSATDTERLPGEYIHQAFARAIFASIAACLEKSGEPLSPAQVTNPRRRCCEWWHGPAEPLVPLPAEVVIPLSGGSVSCPLWASVATGR